MVSEFEIVLLIGYGLLTAGLFSYELAARHTYRTEMERIKAREEERRMNMSDVLQVIREDERGKTGNCMAAYYSVNIPDKGWVCKLTGTSCDGNCKKCVFAKVAWERELNNKGEME